MIRKKSHGTSTEKKLEEKSRQVLRTCTITKIDSTRYKITSQSDKSRHYTVRFMNTWQCSCRYHTSGHGDCKHIMAVQTIRRMGDMGFGGMSAS